MLLKTHLTYKTIVNTILDSEIIVSKYCNRQKYFYNLFEILYQDIVTMHHEAILYSLDPKATYTQIENGECVDYDPTIYSKLQDWIAEQNIHAMDISQPEFHYKFLPIRPRVKIFYYLGNIWLLNQKILGIVGPRKMSTYSQKVLEAVFSYGDKYDFVTVSGMAEGVDQLCHQLSRDHGVPTIAVLGWGLGRYLRRWESELIRQIVADGGLVISEYKLFEWPQAYTFPERNRIVAWLSDVLFLPEAGKKSWSLITVDCALAMKKPVYATPNSIFTPTSFGILQYIESGKVKPVFNLASFFSSYFPLKNISSRIQTSIDLTDEEQWLIQLFSHDEWIDIQSLIKTTWSDLQHIIQLLTMLEIKWIIMQDIPGRYILA